VPTGMKPVLPNYPINMTFPHFAMEMRAFHACIHEALLSRPPGVAVRPMVEVP
jgi:hypothetical protein